MKKLIARLSATVCLLAFISSCASAAENNMRQSLDQTAVEEFINEVVISHGLSQKHLESAFGQANYLQSVIDAITRPAERMPWYRYKNIFLTSDRVESGVKYWKENRKALERAEEEYGVPPEIIVAIIGVETKYGSNTGRYRVIDSLATLAFHYPRRASFFRSELEQFFLLTDEQGVDPLDIKGSYAGAMGIPQFISSSYRHYAIDFDGDGRTDLWSNHVDAIGSVASYFSEHGWTPGEPVIHKIQGMPADKSQLDINQLKPEVNYGEILSHGVVAEESIDKSTPVSVLSFEETYGEDYWLGENNFYVITRYNHSRLYALSVYLLSKRIRDSYQYD